MEAYSDPSMRCCSSEDLLSPPRDWPACFRSDRELNSFIGRGGLSGRRCRLTSSLPSPQLQAQLVGFELKPDDPFANAELIHARFGWPIVKGFAVYELRSAPRKFVARQRWWNTSNDTWVHSTARIQQFPSQHILRIPPRTLGRANLKA